MNSVTVPLKQSFFPLNTVLFPGGILPLQIFEQRYLNLVKDCMKNQHGFVVVLINRGKEVGSSPEIYRTGTYAEIMDWESLDNGLLGIKARGLHTVRILDTTARDDGLIVGHTLELDAANGIDMRTSDDHQELVETLQQLAKHPFVADRYPDIDYSSIAEVCYRLCELLPTSNLIKQELLETRDISQLLLSLKNIISKIGS